MEENQNTLNIYPFRIYENLNTQNVCECVIFFYLFISLISLEGLYLFVLELNLQAVKMRKLENIKPKL